MRDPYAVLGLSRQASADEIKAAYRRLARRYHPDLNPGDHVVEQRFKEVSAAYDLLGDQEKRRRFDRGEIDADGRERLDPFARAHANKARRGRGRAGGDIFEEFFRGSGAGPGTDVTYNLKVSFVEAVKGVHRRLMLSNGREFDVRVPPGTRDGQRLRLKGQGLGGVGSGDAYVEISVDPHPHFRRQGNDIRIEVPVTLKEAVLGGRIAVPTVDGRVQLTVPKGSSGGTSLRLRGKGVPTGDGTRGDQYVILRILLPEKPDPALVRFCEGWSPTEDDPRKKAGL